MRTAERTSEIVAMHDREGAKTFAPSGGEKSDAVHDDVREDIDPQIAPPEIEQREHRPAETGDEEMRPAPGSDVGERE